MMRLVSFCLVLLLQGAGATLYAQNAPRNLDFAKGTEGWFAPPSCAAAGYHIKPVPKDAKNVAPALLLYRVEAGNGGFGNVMQSFSAAAFRGKRIRLRARLKLTGAAAGGRAQMWLRVDRKGEQTGFFDNMSDRPVTAAQGQDVEIIGDIADDAEAINLGFMLLGNGKVTVSAGAWETLGSTPKETNTPLTPAQLDNLIAFTRLLGYVRHFHPSDQSAQTDWNRFAARGMKVVETAQNPAELAQRLQTLFASLAPTAQISVSSPLPAADRSAEKKAATRLVRWSLVGFGGGDSTGPYHNERVFQPLPPHALPKDFPAPDKPYIADLGAGLTAAIPLACYADKKGTLPRAAPTAEPSTEPTGAGELSRSVRLADVALAWNVMQHFYPYFDVVATDWNAALRSALRSAATDTDNRAFLLTLRRLIAALHDGHGGVYNSALRDDYALPLCVGWVEGQVTTLAAKDTPELKPGDVIEMIDGKPAAEVLAEAEQTISGATPQWRRYRALQEWPLGTQDSQVTLEVRTGTEAPRRVKLKRSLEARELAELQQSAEHRPSKIAEVKPGILYLDIDRVNDADIQEALPQMEKAKGIVIDFRGYPGQVSNIMALFAHLGV